MSHYDKLRAQRNSTRRSLEEARKQLNEYHKIIGVINDRNRELDSLEKELKYKYRNLIVMQYMNLGLFLFLISSIAYVIS